MLELSVDGPQSPAVARSHGVAAFGEELLHLWVRVVCKALLARTEHDGVELSRLAQQANSDISDHLDLTLEIRCGPGL